MKAGKEPEGPNLKDLIFQHPPVDSRQVIPPTPLEVYIRKTAGLGAHLLSCEDRANQIFERFRIRELLTELGGISTRDFPAGREKVTDLKPDFYAQVVVPTEPVRQLSVGTIVTTVKDREASYLQALPRSDMDLILGVKRIISPRFIEVDKLPLEEDGIAALMPEVRGFGLSYTRTWAARVNLGINRHYQESHRHPNHGTNVYTDKTRVETIEDVSVDSVAGMRFEAVLGQSGQGNDFLVFQPFSETKDQRPLETYNDYLTNYDSRGLTGVRARVIRRDGCADTKFLGEATMVRVDEPSDKFKFLIADTVNQKLYENPKFR